METYPQMILDGDRNIGTSYCQNTPATMTNILGVAMDWGAAMCGGRGVPLICI